jgi:7-keto-8-aminopelargonate synthetase-like enzyme
MLSSRSDGEGRIKGVILSCMLIMAVPLIAAVGSVQGSSFPEKIPIPDKKYSITFVDQTHRVTECDERLMGLITLRDGVQTELVLNKDRKAFGKTGYGTFLIGISDLKKMVVGKSVQR